MAQLEQRAIFSLLQYGIVFSRINLSRTHQPPTMTVKVDGKPAVTIQLVLINGPPTEIAVVAAFHPPYESLLFTL